MTNHKNFYRNKIDFAHEEFSTELYKPAGIPRPRERASQEAQLDSIRQHGTSKELKRPFRSKTSQPH